MNGLKSADGHAESADVDASIKELEDLIEAKITEKIDKAKEEDEAKIIMKVIVQFDSDTVCSTNAEYHSKDDAGDPEDIEIGISLDAPEDSAGDLSLEIIKADETVISATSPTADYITVNANYRGNEERTFFFGSYGLDQYDPGAGGQQVYLRLKYNGKIVASSYPGDFGTPPSNNATIWIVRGCPT